MSLDRAGVIKMIEDYEKGTKAIKDELLKICWFMRGGVSYNESHCLTPNEREIVSKLIESNLATTKESGLPFF